MGYHCDQMYIGPAIKVKGLKKDTRVKVDSCSNDDCPNSRKSMTVNFCNDCGSPVLTRHIKKITNVTVRDFMNEHDEYEDFLFNPKNSDSVWIPNGSEKEMQAFSDEIEDRTIIIGKNFPDNMVKQTALFNAEHAEMFDAMREYGLEFETIYVIKTFGY